MRMVGEAVEEFKSGYVEETPRIKECKVELPITAHLPTEYVPSERLRLDIYRRMADATEDSALEAVKEELTDRFGPLPVEAENLMQVAHLRVLAKSFGLTEVVLQGKNLRIAPVLLPESAQLRLTRIYPGSLYKTATSTALVAKASTPNWIGNEEIGDTSTLQWAFEVIHSVIAPALAPKRT